jgi:hypothetical protein
MKSALFVLVSALFIAATASASPPCAALAKKVSAGLQAARKMSDSDKAAKCRALELVDYDALNVARDCRAQEDVKFVDETFKPMMQTLAVEMPKACAR